MTIDGEKRASCLLNLSPWCFVMVERLFLAVPRDCLQFVLVVFPDHTHLLFLRNTFFRYFNKRGGKISYRIRRFFEVFWYQFTSAQSIK